MAKWQLLTSDGRMDNLKGQLKECQVLTGSNPWLIGHALSSGSNLHRKLAIAAF